MSIFDKIKAAQAAFEQGRALGERAAPHVAALAKLTAPLWQRRPYPTLPDPPSTPAAPEPPPSSEPERAPITDAAGRVVGAVWIKQPRPTRKDSRR